MTADEKLGQDPPSRLRQSEDREDDVTGSRLQHQDEGHGAEAPERLTRNSDDDDKDDVEGSRLV